MKSGALRLLIGAIVGTVGAAALALDNLLPVAGVVAGGILGACFALLTRSRAATPGAGLLWGLAFSFLLWLAGPAGVCVVLASKIPAGMLDIARAHFPELVGYLLFFGAPVGMILGRVSHQRDETQVFCLWRVLVCRRIPGSVGRSPF